MRTTPVSQLIFRRARAGKVWFGQEADHQTWGGTFKSIATTLIGVALINQLCRGNMLGYVDDSVDVYLPLSRPSSIDYPATYGFVDQREDTADRSTERS